MAETERTIEEVVKLANERIRNAYSPGITNGVRLKVISPVWTIFVHPMSPPPDGEPVGISGKALAALMGLDERDRLLRIAVDLDQTMPTAREAPLAGLIGDRLRFYLDARRALGEFIKAQGVIEPPRHTGGNNG